MGDKAIMEKAMQELEAFYMGIPDASVDLTLKDMTNVESDAEEKIITSMEPIREERKKDLKKVIGNLPKCPSLDFSKALQAAKPPDRRTVEDELYREYLAQNVVEKNGNGLRPLKVDSNQVYDNASVFSTVSSLGEKCGLRKRPGIPHSNICALCSKIIYIFRHRCLVCGRVYCRKCVGMGMGEMTEGRKCVECLGRRFCPRYMKIGGQTGCFWRFPSTMKQKELIWAEKGQQRSNEGRYSSSSSSSSSTESTQRSSVGLHGSPTKSHLIPGTPSRFPNSSPTTFAASTTISTNPHTYPL